MTVALHPRRILVFRLGSIGDFVISLPCFHLIRETNPRAQIALLTNLPASNRIVPAEAVLQGTGLVDSYIRYTGGTRDFTQLRALKQEIASLEPDMLIYLVEPRGSLSIYRDYLFFRWCGIRHFVGLSPFSVTHQPLSAIAGSDLQEAESHRLARQLNVLGRPDFQSAAAWDLHLSAAEISEAMHQLAEVFPSQWVDDRRLLGLSVGTKQPINDWGDENWRSVLNALSRLDFGLVMLGGTEDRIRSDELATCWSGPVLNLCGRISPRVSGAVLRQLRLFLGHDSGPMHLAAAVGTPCVSVFSRRNMPGKWFPAGAGHRVLYPTSRSGTIASIRPRQVTAAVCDALGSDVLHPALSRTAA